eukprot:14999808-Alexandrium_andersonii.AAC.1
MRPHAAAAQQPQAEARSLQLNKFGGGIQHLQSPSTRMLKRARPEVADARPPDLARDRLLIDSGTSEEACGER